MTRIDAPPAFSSVTLRDRYTWHRATLQEWLDMRSSILRRAKGLKQVTDWEREFLDASAWLNGLSDEYHRDYGRRSLVGLLVGWLLSVEDEFGVAARREEARRKKARAIAEKGIVHARGGRNPYYPAPIDLLGIWRAVMAVVARIQWNRKFFERAEAAVSATSALGESQRKRRSRPPRGAEFRSEMRSLFDSLRSQGFDTAITLDDLLTWKAWREVHKRGCSTFATKLTAKLFRVISRTVQRDLTRGVLRNQYELYDVPRVLRDFRDRPGTVQVGVIREREWYRKKPIVVDEVFMQGHTFFPPPPTVK